MRLTALATGIAAALILPFGSPGIGVVAVALLVAATASWRAPRSAHLALFGSLAVALSAAAALVDAGWVVALDEIAALLLATVAVAGPRLVAPLAPLLALRLLPGMAPRPGARSAPALRGALGGVVLVTPFAALFWTGDAAFASLARAIPIPTAGTLPVQAVTLAVALTGSLALALAAGIEIRLPHVEIGARAAIEWALPLTALNLLFLVFLGVQGAALFGGHAYVRRTTGLSYAEYARRGFWQLLGAAVLTLVVIGAASVLARTSSRRERLLLRALLGCLSGLTLVTVVLALHRLRLYEAAYGLSRLRLLAEAACLWLGGLFVLLLLAGVARTVRRRLGSIALSGTALALVAFTAASPDGLVAGHNVDRWRATGKLDLGYMQSLSADAVPAIRTLPEPMRSRALAPIAARLSKDERWTSWNVSRSRARSQLAGLRA